MRARTSAVVITENPRTSTPASRATSGSASINRSRATPRTRTASATARADQSPRSAGSVQPLGVVAAGTTSAPPFSTT